MEFFLCHKGEEEGCCEKAWEPSLHSSWASLTLEQLSLTTIVGPVFRSLPQRFISSNFRKNGTPSHSKPSVSLTPYAIHRQFFLHSPLHSNSPFFFFFFSLFARFSSQKVCIEGFAVEPVLLCCSPHRLLDSRASLVSEPLPVERLHCACTSHLFSSRQGLPLYLHHLQGSSSSLSSMPLLLLTLLFRYCLTDDVVLAFLSQQVSVTSLRSDLPRGPPHRCSLSSLKLSPAMGGCGVLCFENSIFHWTFPIVIRHTTRWPCG